MPQHVAILGCGVIGLSNGIAILEDPKIDAEVTVVAADVPQALTVEMLRGQPGEVDQHGAEYASAWAGAHHVSDAKDATQLARDRSTFEVMAKYTRTEPWRTLLPSLGDAKIEQPLVWVKQTEFFEKGHPQVDENVLNWYPQYRTTPPSKLSDNHMHGCTFVTIDIHVPLYLSFLRSRFEALGGRIIHKRVESLSETVTVASEGRDKVEVLVAAVGLGALTLPEIKDEAVHPVRGQTILVSAPWLTEEDSQAPEEQTPRHAGISLCLKEGYREAYIIPRGNGTFTVGGTRIKDDWDPSPRPTTTHEILTRNLLLEPRLARPTRADPGSPPRPEDVDVLAVSVGLRPARTGGPRIERLKLCGELSVDAEVVTCYGFGGFGYQSNWGAAFEVKALVARILGEAARGETS